jgi:hypothetical protein
MRWSCGARWKQRLGRPSKSLWIYSENPAKGFAHKKVGLPGYESRQPKDCEPPKFSAQVTVAVGYLRYLAYRVAPALELLQQSWFAAFVMGWARKNRASVRGGNLLDSCSEKCAHYSYHQDRNPECAFHGFVSFRVRFPLMGPWRGAEL